MRVIIVGALSIRYIKDNWVEPLKELYDTTAIDVSPILSVHRNSDYIEKYILSILKEGEYDYMFFYSDAINHDFSDHFFETLRSSGLPVITFLADDTPQVWHNMNRTFDHRFSLIATHSKEGYDKRIKEEVNGNFIYLPWGFSEKQCKKIEKKKIYDAVYIGTNEIQDYDSNVYINDGYIRQQLLEAAYKHCKEKGYHFRVFGDGWHRHPLLKECDGGLLSPSGMVEVLNRTKVVLNPGYTADGVPAEHYHTKLRHFEALGCGAFQLVNHNPELAELFEEDKEIVFFHNTDDLLQKMAYYIDHDKEREEIAKRIYKKRDLHTTKSRLKTLFNVAAQVCPPKAPGKAKVSYTPRIKTLCFPAITEAIVTLNSMSQGIYKICKNLDAIHIITGDFDLYNIDYSPLKIKEKELPVIGVKTYLQISSLHSNTIQRKKQNITGIILDETIKRDNLEKPIYDYLRFKTLWLESDDLWPLFNMIIPLKLLKKLAAIFLEKDTAALKKLPYYESGILVSDLIVKEGELPEELLLPPYILKLKELLEKIRGKEERLMVYGAKGVMTDYVLKLLDRYSDINVIGLIDRAMAGEKMGQYQVYAFENLPEPGPTMILISAETSGSAIYKHIRPVQDHIKIVPLYDLSHSAYSEEPKK